MARRKQAEGEAVSLFPFLSILACLIGTLTLLIMALALGQMGREQSEDVVSRYENFTRLKADVAFQESELEALLELIRQAEALADRLRLANEEIARLEQEQQNMLARQDVNSEYAQLLAEANRLRKRLTEIQGEPKLLDEKIAALEEEIRRRQAGPEEAVVQIRPGGSGVNIDPVFVECTAQDIVVLDDDESKNIRIRVGDLDKLEGEFLRLLDRTAAQKNGQVIFLVRPDAIGTYNHARNVARNHYGPNGYCKNGKLPVPSQGKIDLSIFRR